MLQDHWPYLEKQGSGSIVLKGTILPQRGHLAISGDTFGRHSWKMGTIGLKWGEAKDVVKRPTAHRTAPTTKNCLSQKVSRADVDRHWSGRVGSRSSFGA